MKFLKGSIWTRLPCAACLLLCIMPVAGSGIPSHSLNPSSNRIMLEQRFSSTRMEVIHWKVMERGQSVYVREEIHAPVTGRGLPRHVHMLADRLLLELHGDREAALTKLHRMGFSAVSDKPFSPVVQVEIRSKEIAGYDRALRRLRNASKSGLFSVYPDYLARTGSTIPNDPFYATQQPDLALLGAPDAWDVTTGNQEIVVAMIDSGMQLDHADLAGNLFHNMMEVPGNGQDDDGNGLVDDVNGWDFLNDDNIPEDLTGHGTAIAGVIGAVGNNGVGIAGMNWQCQLLPLKAGNSNLAWSAVIQAMDYVIWMKQKGARIAAINNSYAGPISDPSDLTALSNAVTRVEEAGILFIAAAGNNGRDNDAPGGANHLYPSDLINDNVISVAATNNNDEFTSVSNYGTISVDIAAPGASIYSTYLNNGYAAVSGTSLSCARVSGLAGLVYARNRDLSEQQVKSIIIGTGATSLDLLGKLKHPVRIDAAAALQAADLLPRVSWLNGDGTLFIPDGNPVLMEALADDVDGYVVSIDFIIDGVTVGSDTNGIDGWSWNWASPSGSGILQLRATDDDGQQVTTWARSYAVVGPFDYWRSVYWGNRYESLGAAAENADPDADGIANLWEYAIAGDPVSSGSPSGRAGYPQPIRYESSGTRYFGLVFRFRNSDPSLQYAVERSQSGLGSDWAVTSPDITEIMEDTDWEGFHTIRLGFEEAGSSSIFIRLNLGSDIP